MRSPWRVKLGVALGGGAARGLAHIGVLRALAREEIPVDDQVLPELSPDGSAAGRLVVHRSFEDTNGLAMYEAILDLADAPD